MKNAKDHVQDLKSKVSNGDRDYAEKLRVAREKEWGRISTLEAEKQEVWICIVYSRVAREATVACQTSCTRRRPSRRQLQKRV